MAQSSNDRSSPRQHALADHALDQVSGGNLLAAHALVIAQLLERDRCTCKEGGSGSSMNPHNAPIIE